MRKKLRRIITQIAYSPFGFPCKVCVDLCMLLQYYFLCIVWCIQGKRRPSKDDIQQMTENVTFIYKSFERKGKAKRLYRNIQAYYPGIKVIIADDSKRPLDLSGDNLEIIHLPFNSGLSIGLQKALENVHTPYVIRLDDDHLLTPESKFHIHLKYLISNDNVDLISVLQFTAPEFRSLKKELQLHYAQKLEYAPLPQIIPHMTELNQDYIVVAKPPNAFIGRSDSIKEIGYDPNIRMIDHNEFFYRAAGHIVSVVSKSSYVFHYHNLFDGHYLKYRSDYMGDIKYIRKKHLRSDFEKIK